MNRIKLAELRDIAIEYLPAAQQYREEVKARPTEDRESQGYAWALWRLADETIARSEATAVELAAAQLLLGLTGWETYDPSLPRLRDTDPAPEDARDAMLPGIANAAKTLADITGRSISFMGQSASVAHLMPADAPAAKVEAVLDTTRAQVTQNKLRRNNLDPAIGKAINQAKNTELADVYLELKELALSGEKPFTGALDGDALCYTNDNNEPAKLTKDALGKRLKKRRLTPPAAVSG